MHQISHNVYIFHRLIFLWFQHQFVTFLWWFKGSKIALNSCWFGFFFFFGKWLWELPKIRKYSSSKRVKKKKKKKKHAVNSCHIKSGCDFSDPGILCLQCRKQGLWIQNLNAYSICQSHKIGIWILRPSKVVYKIDSWLCFRSLLHSTNVVQEKSKTLYKLASVLLQELPEWGWTQCWTA